MIVLHDKNYPPLVIFELDSFLDIDFKKFKKIFDEFIEKSHKNTVNYNIAIDLYDINDYSVYSIKDISYYLIPVQMKRGLPQRELSESLGYTAMDPSLTL